MTAGDKREELEAVVRRQLANILKRPHTANECTDAILAAADAYAKASAAARKPRERRPAGAAVEFAAPKPLAVHLAVTAHGEERPACRRYDGPSRNWAVTGIVGDVTCGHCRKYPEWRDGAALAGMEGYVTGGAR